MPPRSLDPDNPVDAFLLRLRELHASANSPTPRGMVLTLRAKGVMQGSRSSFQELLDGAHLPNWTTVQAFVIACRGNPSEFLLGWDAAREQVRGTAEDPGPVSEGVAADAGDDQDGANDRKIGEKVSSEGEARTAARPTRSWKVPVAAVSGLIVGAAGALLLPSEAAVTEGLAPLTTLTTSHAVIEVQNKIAVGPDELVEDSTPSYLSTVTEPFCAEEAKKCMVEDTEYDSGTLLVAVCQKQGLEMVNYNRDSEASQNNPNRAKSTRWYRVALPGRRSGFISEVYLTPDTRGGLSLPECPPK
jgi:hypothetical protein